MTKSYSKPLLSSTKNEFMITTTNPNNMKNTKQILAIVVLSSIMLLSGCGATKTAEESTTSDDNNSQEEQASNVSVEDLKIFEKEELKLDYPRIGQKVSSPLKITGQAKGIMYFEGSFEISVLDENDNELGKGVATAKSNWMTEDFVPFEATITFDDPDTAKGFILFKKDNPSGLPENDLKIKMEVPF